MQLSAQHWVGGRGADSPVPVTGRRLHQERRYCPGAATRRCRRTGGTTRCAQAEPGPVPIYSVKFLPGRSRRRRPASVGKQTGAPVAQGLERSRGFTYWRRWNQSWRARDCVLSQKHLRSTATRASGSRGSEIHWRWAGAAQLSETWTLGEGSASEQMKRTRRAVLIATVNTSQQLGR